MNPIALNIRDNQESKPIHYGTLDGKPPKGWYWVVLCNNVPVEVLGGRMTVDQVDRYCKARTVEKGLPVQHHSPVLVCLVKQSTALRAFGPYKPRQGLSRHQEKNVGKVAARRASKMQTPA